MLGLNVYAVTTRPADPTADQMTLLPAHLDYQKRLEAEGVLLMAGPLFGDGAERPEGGLIVLKATDFDHARRLAAEDPFHSSGLRTFQIKRWRINEGSLSLSVRLSDSSANLT